MDTRPYPLVNGSILSTKDWTVVDGMMVAIINIIVLNGRNH